MLSRKTTITVLVFGLIGLFVLGICLVYSFKYEKDEDLFERPAIGKEKAVELARDFISSVAGPNTKYFPSRQITYGSYNEPALYLLKKYGYKRVKKLIKEEKVPYTYWSIWWGRFGADDSVNVCIDTKNGRVIDYQFLRYPTPEDKITNLNETEARGLAEKFLKSQGIDLARLELVNFNKNTAGLQEEYYFKWLKKAFLLDEASYGISLAVKQDRLRDYSHNLELPEDYRYEYKNSRFLSSFWTMLSAGISFLLGIVLIVFTIIKRKSLDWKMAKKWAGVLSLVFLLNLLNEQSSYVFYIDIISKVLTTILFSLVMFILLPFTVSLFKESFARDIFIQRNRQNIISSIIVCYSITFISLTIDFLIYDILGHFKIVWNVGPGFIANEILTSRIIHLSPFLIGIIPAFTEEFFRGFTISFFKKIFKNRLISILIAAFVWGFSHTVLDGSVYPGYITGIEKFIDGVIIGYILLYLGIEIAILWHFLHNFLVTNLFLSYLGGQLIFYASFLTILILLPFLGATFLYFKKTKSLTPAVS